MSFNSLVENNYLNGGIQEIVLNINKICFLSYQLLNYHFTRLIQEKKPLPEITQNLFYQACSSVSVMRERKEKIDTKEIIAYAKRGIELFPDRAEIYCIMGHYFLSYQKYELAYFNIKKASTFSLENAKNKYSLFIDEYCYGDKLTYLLTFLSFKTNRIQDGLLLYNSITDTEQKQNLKNIFMNIIKD